MCNNQLQSSVDIFHEKSRHAAHHPNSYRLKLSLQCQTLNLQSKNWNYLRTKYNISPPPHFLWMVWGFRF